MPRQFSHEARIYGTKKAVRLFLHRRLPVIGYVILTIAVLFSIQQIRSEAQIRSHDFSVALAQSLYSSCKSGNDVRGTIRKLLVTSYNETKFYEKHHLVTAEEAHRFKAQFHSNLKTLHDRNCADATKKLGVSPSSLHYKPSR